MRDHTEILINRSAATHSTFDLVDSLWSDFPHGAIVLSFQLPFPLHVETEIFIIPAQRNDTTIHFRFERIRAVVDEQLKIGIYDNTMWSAIELGQGSRVFECTQCVALMPLWGPMLYYYPRYIDFMKSDRMNEIFLTGELNPFKKDMQGPVNSYRFEAHMANRALREVRHSIRTFLRQYIITSLDDVDLPDKLFSLFASTAPERVFSFGSAPSLLFGLLGKRASSPIRTVTAVDIANALAWPGRDFSAFELQLLALKRLADDGEPAIALVGLMALIEWFLNDGKPEMKLARLLRHSRYEFVPIEILQTLNTAREIRNQIVHESPTRKLATHDPNAYSTRKGVPDQDTVRAFKEAIYASFELYRCVNRKRARDALASANAADASRDSVW